MSKLIKAKYSHEEFADYWRELGELVFQMLSEVGSSEPNNVIAVRLHKTHAAWDHLGMFNGVPDTEGFRDYIQMVNENE